MLSEAGVNAMPIEEAVRRLIAERDALQAQLRRLQQIRAYAAHKADCLLMATWPPDSEWDRLRAAPIGPIRQQLFAEMLAAREVAVRDGQVCTCGLSALGSDGISGPDGQSAGGDPRGDHDHDHPQQT